MAQSSIFVHALPSIIRLTEQYNYEMEISNNPSTKLKDTSNGHIEVVIPYDGEKYFKTQSIDDIEQQISTPWEQEQIEARFGFLGFTKFENTDLKRKFKDSFLSQGFLPLDIPIQNRDEFFQGKEVLRDDRHACQIIYDYDTEPPEILPLQVKVEIYDEETIQGTKLEQLAKQEKENSLDTEDIADFIAVQPKFERGLYVTFQIFLTLPGNVVKNKEEILPQLDDEYTYKFKLDSKNSVSSKHKKKHNAHRAKNISSSKKAIKRKPYSGENSSDFKPMLANMSLEWQISDASSDIKQQTELTVVDKKEKPPIMYSPSNGVIKWCNIEFQSNEKPTEGTGLYNFQTPKMLLWFKQPGEIYQQERLKCKFEVQIPRTYSNLHLYYFDCDGNQQSSTPPIQVKTVLSADMTLYLEDCFKRRTYSPYQHLQFEGVILEKKRLTDIINLLKDQGFDDPIKLNISQNSIEERHLLLGRRIEGRSELVLLMVIEGTRSKTTRLRQRAGGESYTSEKETGNMEIHMRGQFQGDSSRLFSIMNNIQFMLRERFRHIEIE